MIEKILERLREIGQLEISLHGGRCNGKTLTLGYKKGIENAMEIVQEVAKEYGKDTNVRSNWIPTAEMLFPRYGQKVLASVKCEDCKHEVIITTYERQEYWHNGIITAWKPLDAPYQKGE